jgi:hypothetical protein
MNTQTVSNSYTESFLLEPRKSERALRNPETSGAQSFCKQIGSGTFRAGRITLNEPFHQNIQGAS